jgi:hypothetical protein
MNATKTLICILTAGAALAAAAPVFADSERDFRHERDRDRGRYSHYDRYDHRAYNRNFDRVYNRHEVVVVQRPYIVEQPVYYAEPAPAANLGVGAILGAAIGGYIDSRP